MQITLETIQVSNVTPSSADLELSLTVAIEGQAQPINEQRTFTRQFGSCHSVGLLRIISNSASNTGPSFDTEVVEQMQTIRNGTVL